MWEPLYTTLQYVFTCLLRFASVQITSKLFMYPNVPMRVISAKPVTDMAYGRGNYKMPCYFWDFCVSELCSISNWQCHCHCFERVRILFSLHVLNKIALVYKSVSALNMCARFEKAANFIRRWCCQALTLKTYSAKEMWMSDWEFCYFNSVNTMTHGICRHIVLWQMGINLWILHFYLSFQMQFNHNLIFLYELWRPPASWSARRNSQQWFR